MQCHTAFEIIEADDYVYFLCTLLPFHLDEVRLVVATTNPPYMIFEEHTMRHHLIRVNSS